MRPTRMLRPLLIAVVLSVGACGQQSAPTAPAAAPATAPQASAAPAPAASTQTETEQARASQETGADNDHPATQ